MKHTRRCCKICDNRVEKRNKTMDFIQFETLEFKQIGNRGCTPIPKNEVSVIKTTVNTYGVLFSKELSNDIKQFKYLSVKRNPFTSQLYFVFNNSEGMSLCIKSKVKRTLVACKTFADYLISKYNNNKRETFRLKISDDISNSAEYATYEVLGKVYK